MTRRDQIVPEMLRKGGRIVYHGPPMNWQTTFRRAQSPVIIDAEFSPSAPEPLALPAPSASSPDTQAE